MLERRGRGRFGKKRAGRGQRRDEAELNTPDCLNPHPLTLALDTSAKRTSLALTRGGEALALLTVAGDERRSERLWLDLDGLLQSAGVTIEAVELFGVCVGPGSF